MKLTTTKTLTNILNKNSKYKITLEKLTIEQFKILVDFDVWEHEIDYDFTTGKFKVIKVVYPDNFYACDNYITTKDLQRIIQTFASNEQKTLDNFIIHFNNYIEI